MFIHSFINCFFKTPHSQFLHRRDKIHPNPIPVAHHHSSLPTIVNSLMTPCHWTSRSLSSMGICFSIQHQNPHHHKPSGGKGGHGSGKSMSSKAESMSSNKGSMSLIPKDVKELRQGSSYVNVDSFSYEQMRIATKQFRPDLIVGEGGFGIVYKGVLDETVREGSKSVVKVAIKELNPEGFQGDREWLAEINYLGQLSHPNLVKLIGYCCEDEHRLLVYEYMESGSLEKNLFRRAGPTLTWSTRLKIALDAARGLAFLHGAERPIIYRDFKTSNILLDEDFNAKLSDFGLAKEGPMGDQTHVSTRVMGTYGYAAPEYVMTGHLTARSDVYGFGVVLLELLIGRGAMDKSRPSGEHNLVEWARPLLNHKKVIKIFDPRMDGQYTSKAALKLANLAYQCLSQNPKSRPAMSQVVEILEQFQTLSKKETICSEVGSVTLYEAPKDPSDEKHIKNKTPVEALLKSQSDVPRGNRANVVDHGLKRGESEEELDASLFSQELGR